MPGSFDDVVWSYFTIDRCGSLIPATTDQRRSAIGRVVDALLGQQAALVEDVEQDEPGQHDDGREHDRDQHRGERAGRRGGRGDRQALRQHVGPLRHAPGDDDGGDRDHGERPGAPGGVAHEQQQSADAAGAARITSGRAREVSPSKR